MKPIALSLASALVAASAMAAAAAPATAGLDFTDRATFQAATPAVTFNGSAVLGTTAAMTNGFGTTAVTLASTGAFAPTIGASVDFSYNGVFQKPLYANYDSSVATPPYNMVVEFGTITGTVLLQTITFAETGSALFTPYSVNQVLTSANSNSRLHIFIPAASIPLSERDLAQAVRLQFGFTIGAPSSVAINAVVNPEPGTVALFGIGLLGLAGAVRARRRNRKLAPSA